MLVRRTTSNIVEHFVSKLADAQLVYAFSVLNRGLNPVHVIIFFQHTLTCPRLMVLTHPHPHTFWHSVCCVYKGRFLWRFNSIHSTLYSMLLQTKTHLETSKHYLGKKKKKKKIIYTIPCIEFVQEFYCNHFQHCR